MLKKVHFLSVLGHLGLVFSSWIRAQFDGSNFSDLHCLGKKKKTLFDGLVLKFKFILKALKFHSLSTLTVALTSDYLNPNPACLSTEPKQWNFVFWNEYAAVFYRLCVLCLLPEWCWRPKSSGEQMEYLHQSQTGLLRTGTSRDWHTLQPTGWETHKPFAPAHSCILT